MNQPVNHGYISIDASALNVSPFIEEPYNGVHIGDLSGQSEGVTEGQRALGSVYAASASVVLIIDFTFNPGENSKWNIFKQNTM